MREKNSMKPKLLGAMALLAVIGALFVMQSADRYTPQADAATGTIHALNVGTCLTTDAKVFKGDCTTLAQDLAGSVNDWEIRAKHTQVDSLYATYAHDPKSQGGAPRAIVENSDLIQISIEDTDRDKRTGVLIRGSSNEDPIGDDDTTGTLGKFIKDDLGKDDLDIAVKADSDTTDNPADDIGDIFFTNDEHDGSADGIEVYSTGTAVSPTDSQIANSGTETLNFTRLECDGADQSQPCTETGSKDWQFDAADFDVENNGAHVRFYGCLDSDNDGCGDTGDPIVRLTALAVDEDQSNGKAHGDTAPWLVVNASVPSGKTVVILAIYYQTSDFENLLGGTKYHSCTDSTHRLVDRGGATGWMCDPDASGNDNDDVATAKKDATTDPVFTKAEMSGNNALVVKASADGDKKSVNLYLTEKDRFSGLYQGFLRLTDADGDGIKDAITTRDNWGHAIKDGSGATDAAADLAILGVESGPVYIEYKDSGGKTQTLTITIDNEAPAIEIDTPADGSSSGDQSPDFIGTFNDAGSGLVNDSFRLVVDNSVGDENEDGTNKEYALKGKAPNADYIRSALVDGVQKQIDDESEYIGYATTPIAGVVSPLTLYNLGDDSCSDGPLCYIEADSHDDGAKSGEFDDTVKLDLQEIIGEKDADTRDAEFEIDYQAFVMDMAGNIGFSDSDISNPRFINALGEKKAADRGPTGNKGKLHNVLGWYSAHIFTLDEKDPEIIQNQTVTGFYGKDTDKNLMVDRMGIMVVFDGALRKNTVTTDTFTVTLDDKSAATVDDVDVDDNLVFLKLASELKSDATPMIDIANGQAVEDMAGNETAGREVKEFKVNDGISPVLTVTLSGGSGSGTGDEDSTNLTKGKMVVHVASDEPLSGVPRISVVCSSLLWYEGDDADIKHDIGDFIDNRSGAFTKEPTETPAVKKPLSTNTKASGKTHGYTCGDFVGDDNFNDNFLISKVSGSSRPGENWEYTWQNSISEERVIHDGMVTAVAFGRDDSTYKNSKNEDVQSWGSGSEEFRLCDTILHSPLDKGKGDVQPADGGSTKETRPYILIEFADKSSVELTSVEVDDVEVASMFEQPIANRFVYWPTSLSKGDHDVEVKAIDAAGNDRVFEFSFKSEDRGKFIINLLAGWNAISVPGAPGRPRRSAQCSTTRR